MAWAFSLGRWRNDISPGEGGAACGCALPQASRVELGGGAEHEREEGLAVRREEAAHHALGCIARVRLEGT